MFGIEEWFEQMFRSAGGALLVLSIINTCSKYFERVLNTISQVTAALRDGFGPQVYFCFEGYATPLKENRVNTQAAASAKREWLYDVGQQLFIAATEVGGDVTPKKGAPLPILSMEIVQGDDTVYDLTDFLESVRVQAAGEATPSLQHIVGAWGLTSGVILDRSGEYVARMMTTEADIVDAEPFDVRELHEILRKEPKVTEAEAEVEPVPASEPGSEAESESDESLPPPPPPMHTPSESNSESDSKED